MPISNVPNKTFMSKKALYFYLLPRPHIPTKHSPQKIIPKNGHFFFCQDPIYSSKDYCRWKLKLFYFVLVLNYYIPNKLFHAYENIIWKTHTHTNHFCIVKSSWKKISNRRGHKTSMNNVYMDVLHMWRWHLMWSLAPHYKNVHTWRPLRQRKFLNGKSACTSSISLTTTNMLKIEIKINGSMVDGVVVRWRWQWILNEKNCQISMWSSNK